MNALIVLTIATVLVGALVAARRVSVGRRLPWRGFLVASACLLNAWIFLAVFSASGDLGWARMPWILVNLVLGVGAIYGTTGARLHDDGATLGAGTMGMFLGRDQTMVVDGFDKDRFR